MIMKEEEIRANIETLKAQLMNLIRSEPHKFDSDISLPKKGIYAIWAQKIYFTLEKALGSKNVYWATTGQAIKEEALFVEH